MSEPTIEQMAADLRAKFPTLYISRIGTVWKVGFKARSSDYLGSSVCDAWHRHCAPAPPEAASEPAAPAAVEPADERVKSEAKNLHIEEKRKDDEHVAQPAMPERPIPIITDTGCEQFEDSLATQYMDAQAARIAKLEAELAQKEAKYQSYRQDACNEYARYQAESAQKDALIEQARRLFFSVATLYDVPELAAIKIWLAEVARLKGAQ